MSDIGQTVLAQWQAQSGLEIIGVVFAIAYVWLAAEQKLACWPAGLISSLIFCYLLWQSDLPFQSLLYFYYALTAVLGWFSWQKTGQIAVQDVRHLPLSQHALLWISGLLLSALAVIFGRHLFSHEWLWLDAGITVFSLLVTMLTVRKYLQSWLYWMLINALSIYLFWQSELYLLALMMALYIVLAIRGYFAWQSSLQTKANESLHRNA